MLQIQGILFLPNVSKSISRVGKFTRCPAHGNLLAWLGRPLPMEEFNVIAPTVLQNGALYGMQPFVKLVEVEIPDSTPEAVPPLTPVPPLVPNEATKPAGDLLPSSKAYDVEPLNDGFVVVDLRSADVLYRGQGDLWESDISLVRPFATEDEARAIIPQPEITEPAAAAGVSPPDKPAADPAQKTAADGANPATVKDSLTVGDSAAAAAPAAAPKPKAAKKEAAVKKAANKTSEKTETTEKAETTEKTDQA